MSSEYRSTLERLYGLEARRGMDFRLERLHPVLAALGRPERAVPVVHVVGTNGKGSTAALLHSVWHRAGYRTGLYTSPHLLSFRERIRTGTSMISEARVVALSERVEGQAAEVGAALTFFEIATLMAFVEFAEQNVDIAVIEAGLGGRLDATNVVDPLAVVVPSVGLDHREFLGDDLASVATEKAGAIKGDHVVVTGPLEPEALAVIDERVRACGARWLHHGRDYGDATGQDEGTSGGANGGANGGTGVADGDSEGSRQALPGAHQRSNQAVVRATVDALAARFPVSNQAWREGCRSLRWPGRFETVARGPRVVLDGAHNPAAALALAASVRDAALPRPRVLVFGAMRDKDYRAMLGGLDGVFDRTVFVPIAVERSATAADLLDAAPEGSAAATADDALAGLEAARALAGANGSVVVAGSIFLVAQLYEAAGGSPDPFSCDELAA